MYRWRLEGATITQGGRRTEWAAGANQEFNPTDLARFVVALGRSEHYRKDKGSRRKVRVLVFQYTPTTNGPPYSDQLHVATYLMIRDEGGKWRESWNVMLLDDRENPLNGTLKILETIDG